MYIGGMFLRKISVKKNSKRQKPLSLSGYVGKPKGASIEGVLMGGLPDTTYTDSTGFHKDTVSYSWNGRVRPSKGGFSFTPATTSYSQWSADTVTNYLGNGPLVNIHVNVVTAPAGLSVVLDDSLRVSPVVIHALEGSSLTIATDSIHLFGSGGRYRWLSWSDQGARTHAVNATKDTAFTAAFVGENLLSVSSSPIQGGSTHPSGDLWHLTNAVDTISARPYPKLGYHFVGWEGDVADGANPIVVTMDRPKSIVARFALATSVDRKEGAVREFSLSQSYPNPFNPSATIEYAIPVRCHVVLEVFDLLGHRIALLIDESQEAGYKSVRFDANVFATGVYIYRLRAGEFVQTRKLLLMK